jgi:hypothetical protein
MHVSLSWPWHILRISCSYRLVNPLSPELNPICYFLALLAHDFLHVSRIRVNNRPCLTGIFKILIQDSINSEIYERSFWKLQWTPGGVPPRGKNSLCVKLTAHLHLVPTLRTSEAIPLLPPYVWTVRTLNILLLSFIVFENKQWAPDHSWVKAAGVWRWPPTPSSVVVKERVERYISLLPLSVLMTCFMVKVKGKVHPCTGTGCTGRTAHRGSRGIALLFHDQR